MSKNVTKSMNQPVSSASLKSSQTATEVNLGVSQFIPLMFSNQLVCFLSLSHLNLED